MPPHPLTYLEWRKCDQNEPRFNGVFSKNNSPKINLDKCKSYGTHWIALYLNNEKVTYFDSFGVEHIPKEIRRFIGKNYSKYLHNTSIQFSNIRFIDFMLKGKRLSDYTNLFSPNKHVKNNLIKF